MAARTTDQLRTEIERTRRDLGEHMAELRVEVGEAQRKLVKAAAVAAGVLVALGVARFIWRRARR